MQLILYAFNRNCYDYKMPLRYYHSDSLTKITIQEIVKLFFIDTKMCLDQSQMKLHLKRSKGRRVTIYDIPKFSVFRKAH